MILLTLCLRGGAAGSAAGAVTASYLYSLSNFTGTVPYSWISPVVDQQTNEIYVVTGDSVSIFNDKGMEIYRFGEELDLGVFADVAVESDGHILLLSYRGERFVITRCNFRGEPQSSIAIRNLPPAYAGLFPHRLLYWHGRLYLADLLAQKVVVTDAQGVFQEGYDLAPLVADFADKPGSETSIVGFTVDRDGNLLFTVPTLFKAFRLSPDRRLAAFGRPGSLPGKFNVVAGIAIDDRGYIYVADTLRCVVMVFDEAFNFLTEFSQRGLSPESLIAPKALVVDNQGRVYVSQARRRGVSVFKVTYN